MKKAVIMGKRQSELVEVPDPVAREDWVVVKVHAAPMCTEYKSFAAGDRAEFLGHEAAGEVVGYRPVRAGACAKVVLKPWEEVE